MSKQSDTISRLKTALEKVPSMVKQPQDVRVAEKLISSVERQALDAELEDIPAEPRSHPRSPGLYWGSLSPEVQRKYAQIIAVLEYFDVHQEGPMLEGGGAERALRLVTQAMERLSKTPRHPTPGAVQRSKH